MMNKKGIHVFLGAPRPPLLPDEGSEEGSCRWKTVELTWREGRLGFKGDGSDTQASGLCARRSTPEKQVSGGGVEASESPHRQNQSEVGEREDLSVTEDDGNEVIQDDFTPSGLQTSQRKRLYPEEETPYPDLVTDYLDSCFPSSQHIPVSEPEGPPSKPGLVVSMETEYLTTWTRSQALLLRGCTFVVSPQTSPCGSLGSPQTLPKPSPSSIASATSLELYSPAASPSLDRGLGGTLQGSLELCCDNLSQRQEMGGVILERLPEGLLCSQTEVPLGHGPHDGSLCAPAPSTPTTSASKRAKQSPSTVRGEGGAKEVRGIPLCGPTTLLARCKGHSKHYVILVAVVHPCHLKEIKLKSGASAGKSIPLATVVVTDQSGVEMKVVLWRAAAFWALTVYPGDILLITGVTLNMDKWKGETVLQSSYTSRLLNLGQCSGGNLPAVPQNVNGNTLRTLCAYLCEKRPLLVSLSPRVHQDLHSIPHARLESLRPDTLVHALLRVQHTSMITAWREEAEGISRTGGVLKALLTVEQGDGHQGAVVLWGAALAWLQCINRNKDAVWEFRLLLVRQDVTSGLLELHSTPWGSCEPLFPDDTRCRDFYAVTRIERNTSSFEIDLQTLLSQKYTGDVELRAQIVAFQFQAGPCQDGAYLMDGGTSPEKVLDIVSGDITYTGCGRCAVELDTDDNGIYRPCYPCLPHTGVRRCYRPGVLTVKDGDSQVCVQVAPGMVQKMLLDTPPDKLSKTVDPSSDVRFAQVVTDRICSMLSLPKKTFLLTVHSHFQCDEDDIPIVQNFLLLDLNSQES